MSEGMNRWTADEFPVKSRIRIALAWFLIAVLVHPAAELVAAQSAGRREPGREVLCRLTMAAPGSWLGGAETSRSGAGSFALCAAAPGSDPLTAQYTFGYRISCGPSIANSQAVLGFPDVSGRPSHPEVSPA